MSFYTSLTGLNGAQADIAAISNNVANVGTTGFKLSRAQFGDIFATSPLQNASGAVGSGTILKKVQQQFTQGNISASQNSLDMAISGQGFFALKPSLTSTQTVYTRNGNFSVNNNRYVVDTQGQYLQVFPVNSDGSVIATGIQSAKNLQLPSTSGLPNATASIQLGLNLPADASIIPSSATYTKDNPYKFDRTNASTYNQSTSITIYDSLGNPTIATIYYVKTLNATSAIPNNRWQTHVFVGDKEVDPSLITSKDDQSRTLYINKYGQTTTDPTSFDSSFVANQPSPLYYQDDQIVKAQSTPAQVLGSIQNTSGFDFGDTDANQVTITTDPSQYSLTREGGNTALNSPFWGKDMFSISVDGSATQSITIKAGSYTGDELAAEMTRAVNSKFSDSKYFRITDTYRDVGGSVIAGNDVFNVSLSKIATDGSTVTLNPPLEIDLLGTNGAAGTPQDSLVAQQLNYQDLTRDQMINLAQTKVNEALNARHNEFGKNPNWVDEANPPIKVGFDVASRSLTFTADPGQLGPDASLPQNRFQTLQVYNPTNSLNDLGLPSLTSSPSSIIGTNSRWSGQAVLPSGPPVTAAGDQRTGVTVSYNKDTRQFVFSSGSTGETSSIKVGRASLAQVADILPQINSYDFSNVKLAANESIVLESDGRSFTYTTPVAVDSAVAYPAAAGATTISPDDFINNLQEAFPVSFAQTTQSNIGTATQKETQVITPYGNLLNGDKFNLTIQLDKDPASPVSLSVGPLSGFLSDTKTSDRVDALSTAIQNAIDAAATIAGVDGPSCSVVSGQIVMAYPTVGSISTIASMKQTVRGLSDTKTTTAQAETATVTFSALAISKTVTVGGLTLTATAAMTSAEVASAFAGLASGASSGTTSKGTFSGLLSGWSSSVATGSAVIFSSVLSKNVTDLAPTASSGVTAPTVVTTPGVTDSNNNYTYFTDQTVTSSPAVVSTSGNAKTYEIQSLILQPQSIGGSVDIEPGDKYIITVPKSDGSVSTETITVPPFSPAIAPATTAATTGLEALVMKLNKQTVTDTNDSFGNTVHFSVDKDNPNKLVMTYKALGSIVGTFSIKQFARVDSSISGSVATQIRPEAIGPLSLALAPGNGHRLMVEGNPNGEPFRLNVQAGGVVQPAEAEGATGSKTQTGRQIGQSLASNTNSGAIFAGNNDLLGIGATKSETSVAGTGLASTAATAYGSAAITPMNQTFLLNESLGENKMTFTVDGITGTITLPIRAYTGDTFATAIQQRVNLIQDPVTGRVVSGVTVKFDPNNNRLVFMSGTTGSTSQINVVGKANFGLNSVTQTAGKVPTITNLVQATDSNGNKLYVDSSGNITTVAPTTKLQSWSPLYLTPGELTFDTAGKLISPKQGVVYSPFDPGNGSNPLNLTIDYGKFSTQYTQPFSVQSLTQDGYPSGSLNGLTIDASGTVIANYTNGQTNALGKVMIANFANPNGLKQIGNADYVATSVSGDATLGQAGSDGLGSIQAGALENSNVDITEELVKLITAQRNFQANSKAIETETSLTQTIIQIRA